MTKPTIVTRAGKGSALTWTEGDTNLTNLRDATVTIKAGSSGTEVVSDLNGTITLVAGSNITLTGNNSSKEITIDAEAGAGALADLTDVLIPTPTGGQVLTYDVITSKWLAATPSFALADLTDVSLTTPTGGQVLTYDTITSKWKAATPSSGGGDVVSDTSPQLGGDLDVNGKKIVSASGGVIIQPAIYENISFLTTQGYGGGYITFNGTRWPVGNGSNGQVLTTNGSGELSWASPSSSISGNLAGDLSLNGYKVQGNNGYIQDQSGGYNFEIRAASGKNLNIKKGDGNNLFLNDQTWPASGGSSGQFLKTDGSGNCSWDNVSVSLSGNLAGDLSLNGYKVQGNNGFIQDQSGGYNFYIQASSGKNLSIKKGDGNNLFLNDQTWPAAGGSSGQVLTTDGSGNCTWATPSTGGNNIAILTSSDGNAISMPSDTSAQTSSWTLKTAGGSGVTVSGSSFTLPAGTWLIKFPDAMLATSGTYTDLKLKNTSSGSNIGTNSYNSLKVNNSDKAAWLSMNYMVTIGSSTTYALYPANSTGSTWSIQQGFITGANCPFTLMIYKLA